MCSVIATASSRPFAADSMIESPAADAGTPGSSALDSDAAAHPADDAFATLSPQEDRILDLIADGHTNAEIAGKLSLAEKTIKNYVSQIYSKLSVERRSQAARLATERRMRKGQS